MRAPPLTGRLSGRIRFRPWRSTGTGGSCAPTDRPASFWILAGAGLGEGDSLLEALFDTEKMAGALENWLEVAQHMIVRLRTESAHLGGDPVLDAAVDRLTEELGPRLPANDGALPAIIPARYRAGDRMLSFFSTIAQFGSAEDIALSELRIEMMFPADEPTRAALFAMAGQTDNETV